MYAVCVLDMIICYFFNNSFASGGSGIAGIHIFNRKSFFRITNSIVVNNVGGEGIKCDQGNEYPQITYCNVWNNSKGNFLNCDPHCGVIVSENANGNPIDAFNNISLDPYFKDIERNDFALRVESPCIDAGINNAIETDFNGNHRILDGDNNGSSVIDIGVSEYKGNMLWISNTKEDVIPVIIYPIPANDIFYLEYKGTFTGIFTLKLFDMTGKLVKSDILYINHGSKKISIRVDDLVAGFYKGRLFNGSNLQEFNILITK